MKSLTLGNVLKRIANDDLMEVIRVNGKYVTLKSLYSDEQVTLFQGEAIVLFKVM